MPDLPHHVTVNRAEWDDDAPNWVESGERDWSSEPCWGFWRIPESELGLLPADMTGTDAIELGCGTAYVSGWMARRGARVVGIDNSQRQLETARRLAAEHGVDLTLVHGNAEAVPYPDGSFDFAISEYGAATWCDPYAWIPEAHRLLRPGGELVFMGTTPFVQVCSPSDGSIPATERLEQDYFGMHVFDWTDAVDEPGGIEFNLPISEWFALFRRVGFEVLDYLEPRPAQGGQEVRFFVTADWARRWPVEQIWKLRRL